MRKYLIISSIILLIVGCKQNVTKIACVGDSITEGAGIKFENSDTYPAKLNKLLGDKYAILNSGKGGTTLQKDGDYSYWDSKEFTNTLSFNADIIIIKLGTNDTKPQNWNRQQFESDYQALIDTFLTMKSQPQIILCKPVPVFETTWGINDSTLTNGAIPIIEKLSAKNKLEIIDLNTELKNKPELFPDHIHPNESGTEEIAKIVARHIK